MRKGSLATPAFLVLLVLVTGSCGSEPCLTCPTSDTIPPNVTRVDPNDGRVDVPVTDVVVTVTFSEPVDPATVNTSTFVLTRVVSAASSANVVSTATVMSGGITVNGATVTFTPNEELDCFTRYKVKVTTGVKDMAGNSLDSDYEWEFKTMRDPMLWKLPEEYQARHIAVNANGRYVTGVTGAYTYDFFTARFNLNGERDWVGETATPNVDYGCGIAVSDNDSAVYVGRIIHDIFGTEGASVYVDARDANTGALLWSTLVGTHTRCRDIAADEESVYIVIFNNVLKLDAESGNIQTSISVDDVGGSTNTTNFAGITIGEDAVYLSGSTSRDLVLGLPSGNGREDFFVVVYDKEFQNLQWLSQWGDSREQFNSSIALAPSANMVYLAGFSGMLGTSDVSTVLLAFDLRNGEFRWSKSLEASLGPRIISDGDESLYITLGDNPDAPLKLHSNGDIVWVASSPFGTITVAVSDGTVFVVNNTNTVSRYDAETGIRR